MGDSEQSLLYWRLSCHHWKSHPVLYYLNQRLNYYEFITDCYGKQPIKLNSNSNLNIYSALSFRRPKNCSYWNRFLQHLECELLLLIPSQERFKVVFWLLDWLYCDSLAPYTQEDVKKLMLNVKFWAQSCFTFLFMHPSLLCKKRFKCFPLTGTREWLWKSQHKRMDTKCFQKHPGSNIN